MWRWAETEKNQGDNEAARLHLLGAAALISSV
jgi:hypothetical protein